MRPRRRETRTKRVSYKESELLDQDELDADESVDAPAARDDDGDAYAEPSDVSDADDFKLEDDIMDEFDDETRKSSQAPAPNADDLGHHVGTNNEDVYFGPMATLNARNHQATFLSYTYGPDGEDIYMAENMAFRWPNDMELPSKSVDPSRCPIPSPWAPAGFVAAQHDLLKLWLRKVENESIVRQSSSYLSAEDADSYWPQPVGQLAVVVGTSSQSSTTLLSRSDSIPITKMEYPPPKKTASEVTPGGWLFDVGGEALCLEWAPRIASGPQILASTVIPYSGQPGPEPQQEQEAELNRGCIQLWEFLGEMCEEGFIRPSQTPPSLRRVICFDTGRVRNLQWCPVPLDDETGLGLLAALSSDGSIYVFKVAALFEDKLPTFERLDVPMTCLRLENEAGTDATCFTWVNTNRIAVGHADGSITLWSLHPRLALARQLVHQTPVMSISSGYPSNPYHIASTPLAGYATVVDFTSPSYELTICPNFTISSQLNLLRWNDHINGWYTGRLSQRPHKNTAHFSHIRSFSEIRTIFLGDGELCAMASGYEHPWFLVGFLDGSVWAANAMRKLFFRKAENGLKVKVFEHEYRPAKLFAANLQATGGIDGVVGKDTPLRGAARIWAGFPKVENICNPAVLSTKARRERAQKRGRNEEDEALDDVDAGYATDSIRPVGLGGRKVPRAATIHEPATRITALAWNPNTGFSCWAAAAMASGLVRVMDLGLEAYESPVGQKPG